MKQLHISNIHNGMELEQTLYDENNKILLRSGATLTTSIIEKLKNMGFTMLCIKDENNNDIEIETCLSREQKKEIINSLKSLDFYNYKNIDYKDVTKSAETIIEGVSKSKNIAIDLLDIRNDKNYNYTNSLAIAELTAAIAKEYRKDDQLVFKDESLLAITQAALLHSIGKSCKNNKVREKLGIKEYKKEDTPIYAYQLLHDAIIPNASVISVGILFHKTNENGTNCPKGYENIIKRKGVNLFSQIIHVADSYMNLISQENSYNLPIGPAEAMEIIRDTSGEIFNKDVRKVTIYPLGASVKLSNGEQAIVIGNNIGNEGFNYRPIVTTEDGKKYDLLDENYKYLTIIPNMDTTGFVYNLSM